MPSRPLGWVRDPAKLPGELPDRPALHLLSAAPPPPKAASLAPHILSVLDQGVYSSCVANTVAQCIRARHHKLGVAEPKLASRWWTYYWARASHGAEHEDQGTFIRAAFGALRKFGFPTEDAWPYEAERDGRPMWDCKPSVPAFFAAADMRSPVAYYRITAEGQQRVTEVKRAIAAGFCVAFGTLVTERFCEGKYGAAYVGLPQPGDPLAGGHAMTLASYDERGFSGPNSWGTGWGDRGWFHFTPEVIAWDESSDFWIVENVPRFVGARP